MGRHGDGEIINKRWEMGGRGDGETKKKGIRGQGDAEIGTRNKGKGDGVITNK